MADIKNLASQGVISGKIGVRTPETLWSVKALPMVKRNADRLFRHLPMEAKITAIDYTRNLALFPDRQPSIEGSLLDLNYKKVQGEIFYRLRIDDQLFNGKSLRVFFYPQQYNKGNNKSRTAGTIWIVGLAWRDNAYRNHRLITCRRRVDNIITQGR